MSSIQKVETFKSHSLKVIKQKYIPNNWLFLDTETKVRDIEGLSSHCFSIGWTCLWHRFSDHWTGNKDWHFWNDEMKLCKYIDKSSRDKGGLMLCGHNIFFDLQACGFFKYFTEWKWKLDFIYDKGLTYILRCKKDGHTLTVVSTTNWFDQPLVVIGEMLGIKKLVIDFDKATDEQLKVYCKQDVEILLAAMKYYIDFLRKHHLGKLSLTKASQAMTAYRHRFMYEKIIIHKDEKVTALERRAYMGGRTECFRLGHQKGGSFVTLDINSMYPFVMQKYEYPWELVEYNSHFKVNEIENILRSYAVIAEVEISTPEPAFAMNFNKKMIFPIGNFTTFLCSTGLQYAISRGYVKKINNVAIYRKTDLFSHYVKYFHLLRNKYQLNDNLIMSKLCKYMENSLYGKFGEKSFVRDEYDEFTGRTYFKEDIMNIDNGVLTIVTKLMNKIIVMYNEIEGDNSFSGLAAHITENARFELWKLINSTGRDKVLYCDTDSIKIRSSDLNRVKWPQHKSELGALKVEDTSEELFIGGLKHYRTEKQRKIKGIPRKAIEISPGVFEYDRFHRQDTHLRRGQDTGVITSKQIRSLTAKYDKGIVHPDGSVTPFCF